MSKKKGDRTKSSQGGATEAKWEQALLSSQFCDEGKWQASVTFLVGNQVEDYDNIEILAGVVNSGIRRLFSVISKNELYEQVKELGNPKAKKGKETPSNYEVCEPCKLHLDNNEEIPLPLLAKLLKFKLLDIKQKDHKRREAEKKAASEKEKGGKAGGKVDKKERGKSPKKGGGKKTPEPPSAKDGSKMKKRGEEDLDSKYIDDEPDDGPQHYVLVYGFNNPHLFSFLAEIGVFVDCVIRISSEDYVRFEPVPETDGLAEEPVKDEKTLALEEEAMKEKTKSKKELKRFWKDLLPILQKAPEGSKLYDVARLEYLVRNLLLPQNMDDNEEKVNFGTDLFEDIACIVYDLMDAKRQYKNYLSNLNLLHIPVFGQPAAQLPPEGVSQPSVAPGGTVKDGVSTVAETEAKVQSEVDMRYYKELMDTVPLESVSVPLVVDCMLQQVCATEEDRPPPSGTPGPPREDGLDTELAKHISTMAFKLGLTGEEQKNLSEDFISPKKEETPSKTPQLINYHDDITKRLQHLKPHESFNALQSELDMMEFLSLSHLHNVPRPKSALAKKRAARLQEVIHYCATGGLTQSEIDRAFKQFVFECMDLTNTDDNGFISRTNPDGPSAIPWDDPYPFFKNMTEQDEFIETEEPEIMEFVEPVAEEIKSESKSPSPIEPKPDEVVQTDDEGSRPPSRSILKSPSRSGSPMSRKSSTHSVQFDRELEQGVQPGDVLDKEVSPEPEKTLDESMDDIIQSQKRNLDEFCFAEHFEPRVLKQVLNSASYTLPYLDTYYHKRDHSLMVVLQNPIHTHLYSHTTWQTNLHSNVGFRNYLEHVAESIDEWTKTEESKYEASQLAEEVEKIQKDADDAASRPSSGKDKKARGRSKSPKKSPKDKQPKTEEDDSDEGRKSPGSRGSSAEGLKPQNPFIRPGSLKALKAEQDRIRAEEEAKEKEKADKRAKSASKKASKEKAAQEDKEKKEKRPGSRGGSAKSRTSKDNVEQAATSENTEEVKEEEPYWPFTGYNTGDNMIHTSGITSTMFPADGGQVRTERVDYIHGTTTVKTSVIKDGHLFMIHVLDPKVKGQEDEEEDNLDEKKDEGTEKADTEKSEKQEKEVTIDRNDDMKDKQPCVGAFGSFSARMNDGICVSLSAFGDNGQAPDGQKYEPEEYVIPVPRSPSPSQKESPSKGRKNTVKDRGAPTPVEETQDEEINEVPEEPPIIQKFQPINLTSPDGLQVSLSLESSMGIKPSGEDDRKLLVRQSYPSKTAGIQPCEDSRKKAMQECSRVIDRDGTVVKTMLDGSVQILYADGTVIESLEQPATSSSRQSSPQRVGSAKSGSESPTRKGRVSRKQSAQKETVNEATEEETPKRALWMTTLPSGDKVITKQDGTTEQQGKRLVSTASDPQTRQVMATREDHVIMIGYPDGSTIVEHADKTRITVCYKQVQVQSQSSDEAETGEEPQIETKEVKFVQVECPGFATVKFDQNDNHCSTEFGSGTTVNISVDGTYNIYPNDGGMLSLNSDGSALYYPKPSNNIEYADPNQQLVYVMKHSSDVIFETIDNEGNVFNVANTGMTSEVMAGGSNAEEHCEEEDNAKEKSKQELVVYKQHAPRFFIIHGDGSGTELLRYQDVAKYLLDAEDDPTSAIMMDTLPDYPGVMGVTVLKPLLKGVSEIWLQKYEMDNIIPGGLTSRDLKGLPSKEIKTPGPVFGTNIGQGLSIGSVTRPITMTPILQTPNKLELRQLVQYKPVSQELRNKLNDGLKSYATYVKARNEDTDYILVNDPRSEEEKIHASDLLATMQNVNELTKAKLEDDMTQSYSKATAQPLPTPPPTPQAKRTQADWERDRRELEEEAEGRRALRKHDVPPYFESEFGKAFLLSQAPDMENLAKDLAKDARREDSRTVRSVSASTTSERAQSASVPLPETIAPPDSGISDRSMSSTSVIGTACAPAVQDSPLPTIICGTSGNTPNKARPGNPTPLHAEGQATPNIVPTPNLGSLTLIAKDSSGAEKSVTDTPFYPSIVEKPQEEMMEQETTDSPNQQDYNAKSKLMHTNVVGESRTEPVRVPAFLKGGRPNAATNERYNMVEEPVRRKVYNTSIAGATDKGRETITDMRGFELLPDQVDFGILREGNTYKFAVLLKNTGVDSCRFRIRQPPPSTGLKVEYQPGPVAAGMKANLDLVIYAIAVGVEGETGVGSVSHNLQIVTETHTLFLPITATVLTVDEYDNRGSRGSVSPGVTLQSTKPPGGQGIFRPRKESPEVPTVQAS